MPLMLWGKGKKSRSVKNYMISGEVFGTLAASIIFASAILILRYLLVRRFRDEHRKVLFVLLVLVSTIYAGYIAYIWRFFEIVIGFLATAGALGLLLALSLVPWMTDILSGISIALDPRINIGSEVEVDGKRGKIIDITLTRTIVSGDECIILIPNRKFRDSVVVVYSTKTIEKLLKM